MYITVIHDISDPEKFSEAVQSATAAGFPDGITLHCSYPSANGTRSTCLWEADTVDAVRDLVEPAVGEFSNNEYFEVSTDHALGLPG
jgi:hypothetical protein